DQHQIGCPDVSEMHAERIDPEMLGMLRIAGGDVPGNTLIESEPREEPESGCHPLLAMQPFLRAAGEFRWGRQPRQGLRWCWIHKLLGHKFSSINFRWP